MPMPNPAATILVPQTILPASFLTPLAQTPPATQTQSPIPGILPSSQTATPIAASRRAPNGFAAPADLMPGIDCPVTLLPAPAAADTPPAK
jgi:hypothetical protein